MYILNYLLGLAVWPALVTVDLSQRSPFMNGHSGTALLPIPAEDLHKVDRHTLPSEATAAADAVDVELAVVGQVIANHQGHLPGGCG